MSIADTVPTAETAAEPVQPFSSLSELRSEHLKLLRAMRSEKGEDLIRRVADFLSRAQETGTLIDERADREAAQAILDYWTAWQFSSSERAGLSAAPAILAPFDASKEPDLAGKPDPYQGLQAFAQD